MNVTANPTSGRSRVLYQWCGAMLGREPPIRQPAILRPGAAIGLELLDLLLDPQHVVRVTDEVMLLSTVVLGRRFQVDVSLDRLSRQKEEGATELWGLISGAPSPPGSVGPGGAVGGLAPAGPVERQLWLPLVTVPRPVEVPVAVYASDGSPLARPPQHEVRLALEAALYHILRESLRSHPTFDEPGSPVNALMRHDDPARWLLQAALVEMCEAAPNSLRSLEREAAVRDRLAAGGVDLGGLDRGADLAPHLPVLVDREPPGHRRLALEVLCEALAGDDAFLELVDLVYSNYVVMAGVDPRVRDHSLHFSFANIEALEESVNKSRLLRNRRTLDPREHNYTVHFAVPLPGNVRAYRLHVSAPGDRSDAGQNEVNLVAGLRFGDHPGRSAIDAVRTCAAELAEMSRRDGDDGDGDPDPRDGEVHGRIVRYALRFVAGRALAALAELEAVVEVQARAAVEMEDRWRSAPAWTITRAVARLGAVIWEARNRLDEARKCLEGLLVEDPDDPDGVDEPDDPASVGASEMRAADLSRALVAVADAMEDPLLGFQVVSADLPGQEVARIGVNQPKVASRAAPRPQLLDVWATVSDEAQPYGVSSLLPPIGLTVFVYLVGALLFDAVFWPWHIRGTLDESVLGGTADAIVAVLLLVPGFAVTQMRLPARRSVSGLLRRPGRVFVIAAVVMLSLSAIVVAVQVGRTPAQAGSAGSDSSHPYLVLWTFRGAMYVFLVWSAWALVAWGLRGRNVWRPKGLPVLFGPEPFERDRWWARVASFERKDPDATFDLASPGRPFWTRTGER